MSLDDELKNFLAGITPKEREIMKRKFGITLSENSTIEELHALTSITSARIRKIEAKALKILKERGEPDGEK